MPIKKIDVTTLNHWIANGEALIVDVREPAEHAAENIFGATSLPLGGLTKTDLPKMVDKKLVIHCLSGKRSNKACEKLLAEDPNLEVYDLEGGITAWSQAGYPVRSSGKFMLPLDRQVQLTIGLGVLAGSILAYFANPVYSLLTGFFGAGLTYAGVSGTCALATVMAKMPWNRSAQKTC